MTIMRLRSVGNTGVTTDIPAYDLKPSDWSWANNVRFQANRVQKIGGAKASLTRAMPKQHPLGVVQRPLTEALLYGTYNPVTKKGELWEASGNTHTKVSKKVSGAFVDYNATPQYGWDYTTLSNTIIFNTRLSDPQGIKPGQANFSDLPNWGYPNGKVVDGEYVPDGPYRGWKANRIRAFKNYLLCMGIWEDGIEYPQRVRWSSSAMVGELPANWFQNLDTLDGGFNDLTDSLSHIIDGRPLRDSFVVYTNRDTFIMDYVGGTMVFNFRKIFSDSGMLAPNCCVEFEGKHFVISEDDIFVHNGSTRQSVATGRVKDYLMGQISQNNYDATRVYAYPAKKEIWIAYVSNGNTGESVGPNSEKVYACDKAAVWSWQYDTWSFTDLPYVYDIGIGISPETDTRFWNDEFFVPTPEHPKEYGDYPWEEPEITDDTWEREAQAFTRHVMFGASSHMCFYQLDAGYTWDRWNSTTETTNPVPVVCELQRAALDFDEQEPDISYHKWWRAVYPQMGGEGTVRFYIGGSNSPNGEPTWDSWQDFDIENDSKVDCFSNYRYPAIRLLDASEGTWSMVGYDVEYFREGNR
ncbi:virion structural protein [Salmonella phage SeKF_80]